MNKNQSNNAALRENKGVSNQEATNKNAISNLKRKLTKGISFTDWKTKWSDHDLRISIIAPDRLQNLAHYIEYGYYKRGEGDSDNK